MTRETLRIDSCRGNDDFQVWALWQQLTQIAEDKVDIQTAFVRFIDNDGVVLRQHAIVLNLGQQNTVGHQFDQRGIANLIVKSHFITDDTAHRNLQLFGNPVGHRACGQTTWLSMANQAVYPAPELKTDLRQLRCFTRAGFPRHNHNLMLFDSASDLVFFLTNRQDFWVVDTWYGRATGIDTRLGALNLYRQFLRDGFLSLGIFYFLRTFNTAQQTSAIPQGQAVELWQQGGKRRWYFLVSVHYALRIHSEGRDCARKNA